ncbi:hypothetical protein ADUPG1_011037 [Aduncisulcus paluster]|uniref:Uncharacterized protein n=1 Tax=Aduncisulcus paluster TaxID=2918883 RepID=A0ABQ5JXG7_9EUKA|nr:hypothetical protein ADUPG1_011037 [Aduncisulcus paluster]
MSSAAVAMPEVALQKLSTTTASYFLFVCGSLYRSSAHALPIPFSEIMSLLTSPSPMGPTIFQTPLGDK